MPGPTSRGVVFPGDGTWEQREFQVPAAPENGAILKVEAAGMCHSDIDQLYGIMHTPWGGEYPSIPGHEIVGRIHELGRGTAQAWGVNEGDRVAVRAPRITPDGRTRVYGHDYSVNEGSGLYGGYADYMELLPGTVVFKLPETGAAEELTFFEPLSCAVGWVEPVTAGDTVVIEGPGHMGLATIVAAKAAGASKVIITGTDQDALRLETALRAGADYSVNVDKEDVVERVQELTGGIGGEVVIDAASGTTATVTQAMKMVKVGGCVVIAGMKDRKPVEGFISDWIPMRRIRIFPGSGMDIEGAIQLLWDGKVPTSVLVGETFPLENVGEALRLLDRKEPGRDAVRVGLRL
jgi:threonine dehydrogenase-like Zn-dependent dehydrogenase